MASPVDDTPITISPSQLRALSDQMQRFLLEYRFGMQEVETKVGILRDEFQHMHDYNPIEHVSSRLKSPDSIVDKVARKGLEPDFEAVRAEIPDLLPGRGGERPPILGHLDHRVCRILSSLTRRVLLRKLVGCRDGVLPVPIGVLLVEQAGGVVVLDQVERGGPISVCLSVAAGGKARRGRF